VIGAALLLSFGVKATVGSAGAPALTAFAIFVTAVVFAVAAIANNNLQDLKTGQLVDATPWKQQVALLVGVLVGAAIIPPVMDLLNHAYGFAGGPGVNPARALPAPQATLISALAKGVLQGQLNWTMIGVGAAIGVLVIVIDEALGAARLPRLAPLAVGLGIYLPMSTVVLIVVGAISGWAYDKRAERRPNVEASKRLGVLLASGFIVGESLIGIGVALAVVATGLATPLAIVGDSFQPLAVVLTFLAFAAIIVGLYVWIGRMGGRQPPPIK